LFLTVLDAGKPSIKVLASDEDLYAVSSPGKRWKGKRAQEIKRRVEFAHVTTHFCNN
jgi:hypothetical protein